MIPNQSWFPTNLSARADFYVNFNTQFQIVAASLGLTAYITPVGNDTLVIQFLGDIQNQLKAFDDAARQYRRIVTEDPVGQPQPDFPPMPKFVLPIEIPTGMFERLDKLRDKIIAADNYTDEIGALLGILPKKAETLSPSDAKPTVQAFASQNGYEFSVVAGNRAGSDSWDVMIRRAGQESWKTAKTATGKSVDVVIEPTVPDKPEQLQVMIQLRKNNEKLGQPSDAVYVTVNP